MGERLTERRWYRNAPIIEATISLGVVTPATLTVEDLDAIEGIEKGRYTKAGNEYFYSGEVIVPEPGAPPEHDDVHEHLGYGFSSDDGRQFFRARLDTFDFSVAQPYDAWEPFRNEARRLWDIYKEVSGVNEISRVAVRYVNRIDVPTSVSVDLNDYLHIYPEIPDDMPSGLTTTSFFMQVQLWQPDLECMLVINEAPARSPEENIASIRLDLDLFEERYDDPRQTRNDAEVWRYLDELRNRKNDVFEACITEETRRLIQ